MMSIYTLRWSMAGTLLLFLASSFTQKTANDLLQPLIRANGLLALPTSVHVIRQALGRSYTTFDREDFDKNPDGWGNRYHWQFANGLDLIAQSDGQLPTASDSDEIRGCFLTAPRGQAVVSLLELVLNETTKAHCEARFGAAMKRSKAPLLTNRLAYQIRRKDSYLYLVFNRQGVLAEVWQTAFDLETAG